MDLEELRLNLAELQNSSSSEHDGAAGSPHEHLDNILKSIIEDDSARLIPLSSILSQSLTLHSAKSQGPSLERSIVSRLLHFCCMFDAVDCAAALLNGDVGMVPLVNDTDVQGRTALHTAAEVHAPRCIELLLRKRARTDVRTKDKRGRLALDLALCSSRMDVVWNADENSIEDLIICLEEKDLSSVRLLTEKTKEIADVAYAQAMEGRVVSLAALLMVAAEKITEIVMVLHDADSGCKQKSTIYESLVIEALALGRVDTTSSPRAAKRTHTLTQEECNQKRKLLICEIELLQLFGDVAFNGCTDRKVLPPLILATQAGDEAVIEVLLKTNSGIDDTDAEGNSPLHWCLKKSKMPPHQQMKILSILLKHGARVDQKNMLGLTAVHVAAANGNLEALKVLIEKDPESINYTTAIKETPLFFAVNNERMDCAELLLQLGANSEVLNLRNLDLVFPVPVALTALTALTIYTSRQRPIDMARSQDMRFMLNSSNIIHMSRALALQSKFIAKPHSESNDAILKSEGVPNATEDERICSNAKTELLCKYFESGGGCSRGSQCFFAHGKEELQQLKQQKMHLYSVASEGNTCKVFVGGLPISMDSDSLGKAFEERFGSVEDAIVLAYRIQNQVQSRGFGFVTFKHEKSASDAVEAHYITISGKQVEIKSAVQYPKTSSPKSSPKNMPALSQKHQTPSPNDLSPKQQAFPPSNGEEEINKVEPGSWIDRLINGQPKPGPEDSLSSFSKEHQTAPKWLRIFLKWLPSFLRELSKNGKDGKYALSSLKTDFRTKFGIEMDHASIGFPKLSDFIKSFPQLCCLKHVPTGHIGLANHMVILPTPTKQAAAFHCIADSTPLQHQSKSPPMNSCVTEDGDLEEVMAVVSLKQYELFPNNDSGSKDMVLHQKRNMLLEVLHKRKGSSSLFIRDISFFMDYTNCMARRCCFWCREGKMIWANLPCQHLLWCSDCKVEAVKAAGTFLHKCVICDASVQKIDPTPYKDGLKIANLLHDGRRVIALGQVAT